MALSNFLLAISLIGLILTPISVAQNTPKDYVDAHNAVRAEVGVDPVSWDETLAAYAQNYSNSKIETCELVHSHGPYGENLAEGYGELTAATAVKYWADEKKNFEYDTNRCVGGECRHYTQVVWSDSIRLGCATAKCKNNWVFLTCSYNPPGNYEDMLPY